MSIETYASQNLAAEILKPYNYVCGLLPVRDTASDQVEQEFAIRVTAEDPVFTWGTKRDGGERFPSGFMYSKFRDGSYVIFANENETAVELAERLQCLADQYLDREAANNVARTA